MKKMIESTGKKYIENLCRQYQPEGEEQSKLKKLKNLDAKVRRPAEIFAYVFGAVGTLVLGTGMCLAMRVIFDSVAAGVMTGVLGIAMVSANYFIYRAILARRRRKYSEQIIKLGNELLNKEEEDN